MRLIELSEYVKEFKSLRSASEALSLPVQNVHWALTKVKGKSFVLEEDDGTLRLLREVVQRKGG